MPNWSHNYLIINDQDFEKMKSSILNDKGQIDYQILSPMPEAIIGTISGTQNNYDLYAYLSDKGRLTPQEVAESKYAELLSCSPISKDAQFYIEEVEGYSDDQKQKAYDEGKALVSNYEKYGGMTWYDWAWKNWGVKWNAKETQISHMQEGTILHFDSPWNPPHGWLQTLAAKFPECKFTLEYEIVEMDCEGKMEFEGGKITSHEEKEIEWERE